jgi:branched-chain amino acid aminotransferase
MNWGWVEDARGGGLTQNPTVSAFDSGFTLGNGIFETMKTRQAQIQFLDFHLQRMEKSARALHLEFPGASAIDEAAKEVLQANQPQGFGRLRISLTQGEAGITEWTLVITWQSIELWDKPARLTLSDVTQFPQRLSKSMKTLSYIENAFALKQAQSTGFDDAILFDASGFITETGLANIFIVRDGQILTSPRASGCLLGVTRNIILTEFSRSYAIGEIDLTLEAVQSADEVFITSAIRDIQPVECVDSWHYSAPGVVTSALLIDYREYAEGGFQ